jgi:phage terminase small subunit
MGKLTDKQKIFVAEYLIDKNATQAAIRAGYSAKTANEQGSRLLTNVSIRSEIDKRIEQVSKRAAITAERILERLDAVAERCMQAEPVLDREGNPIGEYKFDSSGANRANELLGKHLKLFTDKIELDVTDSLAERMKKSRERLGKE